MPALWREFPGGPQRTGGINGYPLDRLYEEVAFIGYYLHWPHDQVIQMPHSERRKWCEEISKVNRKLTEEAKG